MTINDMGENMKNVIRDHYWQAVLKKDRAIARRDMLIKAGASDDAIASARGFVNTATAHIVEIDSLLWDITDGTGIVVVYRNDDMTIKDVVIK